MELREEDIGREVLVRGPSGRRKWIGMVRKIQSPAMAIVDYNGSWLLVSTDYVIGFLEDVKLVVDREGKHIYYITKETKLLELPELMHLAFNS